MILWVISNGSDRKAQDDDFEVEFDYEDENYKQCDNEEDFSDDEDLSINHNRKYKLIDTHCHPHDDERKLHKISKLKTERVCIMGVNEEDWVLFCR